MWKTARHNTCYFKCVKKGNIDFNHLHLSYLNVVFTSSYTYLRATKLINTESSSIGRTPRVCIYLGSGNSTTSCLALIDSRMTSPSDSPSASPERLPEITVMKTFESSIRLKLSSSRNASRRRDEERSGTSSLPKRRSGSPEHRFNPSTTHRMSSCTRWLHRWSTLPRTIDPEAVGDGYYSHPPQP